MTTVGIRELRNRLSRYLEAVKNGEEIAVTDRGNVVAHISPGGRQDDPLMRKLAPLIASRTVRAGGSKSIRRPHKPVRATGKSGSRMIIEDRG